MTLRHFMMKAAGRALDNPCHDYYRAVVRPKLDAWAKWRRRSGDI